MNKQIIESLVTRDGGKLLNVIPKSNSSKIFYFEVECSAGHRNTLLYSKFQFEPNRKWCPECRKSKQLSTEEVIEKLGEKNLLLDDVYNTVYVPIKIKCKKCNYGWIAKLHHIFYGRQHTEYCPKCNGYRVLFAEDVRNIFIQNNINCSDNLDQLHERYNTTCVLCGLSRTILARQLRKKKHLLCPNCAGQGLALQRTGIIYKITFPNTWIYIGQTIRQFYERKVAHRQGSQNPNSPAYDTKIARAIRYHGFDNLKWDILHINVPLDKLNELEIREIKNYDSYHNGYNSTEGGENHYNANESIQKAINDFKARQEQELKQKQKLEQKELLEFQKEQARQIKLFEKNAREEARIQYKEKEHEHRAQGYIKSKGKPKSSQYLGVCYDTRLRQWKASVKQNGKKIHIGMYSNEKKAAEARDAKVKELGLNTKLNF